GISHPVLDNVWNVTAPPTGAINDATGIGFLVNPSYNAGLGALDFSMHDHHYVASNVPDPTRAVITFQFASPTVVDALVVIGHAHGLTLLHAYVGNSLSAMPAIGAAFGSLGDLTGPSQMFDGEQNIFDFHNSIAGTYFQVVIERTSLADG